jgi:hypothetical protein
VNSLITIAGKQIEVKEYQGQRVVTFKDVDMVHERVEGTAKRNFNANKSRFIENTDYFFVKPVDVEGYEFRTSEINNAGTYLVTESGYLMLVKSFTDDLAWQVQRQLVNNYFRAKQVSHILSQLSPQTQVLINLELRQKELENQLTDTRKQITTIKDTIANRNEDWRKDVNKKLRKIGFKYGKYDEFVRESYELLETRARCNLNIRLENYKERLRRAGATKTAINKANYLDVISQDDRLKEIYVNIVNQMYIKYAV